MTDAEIRAQLDEQIERGDRSILVDPPENGPPLMILLPSRLTTEAMARFKQAWREAWTGDCTGPRHFVFHEGVRVFQLVDGKWTELGA